MPKYFEPFHIWTQFSFTINEEELRLVYQDCITKNNSQLTISENLMKTCDTPEIWAKFLGAHTS